MTKPLQEDLAKLPISFEVQTSARILESSSLGMCGTLRPLEAAPAIIKPRTKSITPKTRLGKVMHRLHNLEADNKPEKRISVDLDVDLYQMESY